jgi:hypothetical protein
MSSPKAFLKLRELYDAGILTEDEYVTARRKLLGRRVPRIPPIRSGRDSDLPLLFALAALAFVASAAAIYFLTLAK